MTRLRLSQWLYRGGAVVLWAQAVGAIWMLYGEGWAANPRAHVAFWGVAGFQTLLGLYCWSRVGFLTKIEQWVVKRKAESGLQS